MLTINNVATQDTYTPATTLESLRGGRLVYVVANQAVLAQFKPLPEKGGTETAEYGSEVLLVPQVAQIDRCSAVRFRSAIAGTPAAIIAQLAEPGDIVPSAWAPFAGVVTPGSGTPAQSSALLVRSAVDAVAYLAQLTHDRHLLVAEQNPYSYMQVGRLILHDTFKVNGWPAVGGFGTSALDATRLVNPDNGSSLLVTSPAGPAGAQGIARKAFPLPADQGAAGVFAGIHLGVSFWFQMADVNCRGIQLLFRPDDSLHKWLGGMRFFQKSAGVPQSLIQYLDSTGTFVTITGANGGSSDTYPIADGGGGAGDSWHFVEVILSYGQTSITPASNGYLRYHAIKFDDFTWAPGSALLLPGGASNSAELQATNGHREMFLDLVVETDQAAAAAALRIGELVVSDLCAVNHLV